MLTLETSALQYFYDDDLTLINIISWYQTLTFYKKWYLKQEACWTMYGTSCKKLKLKGGNHAVNKVFTMLDGPGHRGKIMLGGYQMMLGLSLKKLVLCS